MSTLNRCNILIDFYINPSDIPNNNEVKTLKENLNTMQTLSYIIFNNEVKTLKENLFHDIISLSKISKTKGVYV